MKVIVGLLLLIVLLAFEYWWFRETMQCMINRTNSGIVVDWAMVKDCSY